jgi:hypothetical protein
MLRVELLRVEDEGKGDKKIQFIQGLVLYSSLIEVVRVK